MSAGEVIAPKEDTQLPVSPSKIAEPCVVADAGALCTPAMMESRAPSNDVAFAPPPLLSSSFLSVSGGIPEITQTRPARRMHLPFQGYK